MDYPRTIFNNIISKNWLVIATLVFGLFSVSGSFHSTQSKAPSPQKTELLVQSVNKIKRTLHFDNTYLASHFQKHTLALSQAQVKIILLVDQQLFKAAHSQLNLKRLRFDINSQRVFNPKIPQIPEDYILLLFRG